MSVYGLFSPSVLGMESQSHAIEVTASNISNMRTGGFKRTDVDFATVFSETVSSIPGSGDAASGSTQSDLGGAVPVNRQRVSLQGLIESTDRALDVAVNGQGMFVFNSSSDGSGREVFGRDGRFSVEANSSGLAVSDGYLVDKNGYYVQGYPTGPGQVPPTGGTGFQSIHLPSNLSLPGTGTVLANLNLNLPAAAEVGGSEQDVIGIYDATGGLRDLSLNFTRSQTPNTWSFDATAGVGDTVTLGPMTQPTLVSQAGQAVAFDSAARTVRFFDSASSAPVADAFALFSTGDTLDIAGAGTGNGAYVIDAISADRSSVTVSAATPLALSGSVATPVTFTGPPAPNPVRFRSDGVLDGPSSYTVDIQHADGATSAFTLDLANTTQFGDVFQRNTFEQDGFPPGALKSLSFDEKGDLIGSFDSGRNVALYRLAMADFTNPDGLDALSGNVYEAGEKSGSAIYGTAGRGGIGELAPESRELSNVNLVQEFAVMTKSQSAYNASATSFKTLDEMTQTARDLTA